MMDSNKARDELHEILNGREYQVYYESNSQFSIWWEKAKNWIAEQLAKLFPSIEPASFPAGPVLIIIIIAVISLLGLTVFLMVRNRRRNQMFRDKKPLQSSEEMNWSFRKHLSEAKKLEASEEYTQSTRHLFLALLLYFHEKEWLEAKIWKTNWEYYEELRKVNRQWADQFYHLAYIFDGVTYGEHRVQKEEFIQFQTEAMTWLSEMDESTIGR